MYTIQEMAEPSPLRQISVSHTVKNSPEYIILSEAQSAKILRLAPLAQDDKIGRLYDKLQFDIPRKGAYNYNIEKQEVRI